MITVLPLLVGKWFQVLFHSPPGVLFTFPSRYLFTIGRQVVFSLGRWSSQLPTGFHVPRGTQGIPRAHRSFTYGPLTLCGEPFQVLLLLLCVPLWGPYNPRFRKTGFGLIRVRSPLLAESLLISFPPGTEMFQFPGFASGPKAG